jgi:hypothetical protein
MFKWLGSRVFWGLLLILAGVLFMLQTLNVLPGEDIFWALVLGGLGVAFLSILITNRSHWWVLIPGTILLFLGIATLAGRLWPAVVDDVWRNVIILGGIGLSFWLVYIFNTKNWWSIIPAGVLTTLAIVVGLRTETVLSGGVFFLGLGCTFLLVALLPNPVGRMWWAYIPGGILVVLGILTLVTTADVINYIWPAALILVGLFLILRTFAKRK